MASNPLEQVHLLLLKWSFKLQYAPMLLYPARNECKTERVFPFLGSLCAPAPLKLKPPLFVKNITGIIVYVHVCINRFQICAQGLVERPNSKCTIRKSK